MNKEKITKIIFILLPFLLAFPFHFIYDLVPFPIFAIYFPTNESVFEHTKLLFTSLIVTYIIFFIIKRKYIDKEKYLSQLIISIAISTISMLAFYYLFNLITNKEIMILNILSLLLGIILGQIISMILYKKGVKWSKEISIYALITLTFTYTLFTANPPFKEFFIDNSK